MTKKILILTLSLLTISLVSKAQVEIVSTESGGTYYVTVPGTFVLTPGLQVTFKANVASSASMMLEVFGSLAKPIRKEGGVTALAGGDIKAGQIVTLAYDGANWQMMNPVGTVTAPTNYWSPSGADIYSNNGGNVTVNADNSDGAYKMAIGKNASAVEKVLALTNTNNFVGGGTTMGFRSNFGGTLWDQALISGITGPLSSSGELAFSVMQNRGALNMTEVMRIKGSTGRVGIGTTAPDRTLHILGDGLKLDNAGTNLEIYPSGSEFIISTTKQYLSLSANGGGNAMFMDDGNIWFNLPITLQDGSQGLGRVLASDAAGNATWTDLSAISSGSTAWTRSAGNIYPTTISDKVGIGTTSPTTSLQIHSTSGSGNLRLTSAGTGVTATDGFSLTNDGTTEMFITQHENANWYFATNGGTIAMTILPSGKIGVGMTSPSAQLEVQNSTASATEKIGVFGTVTGTGGGANVGVRGYATGSTLSNYGVNANAYGNSGTKYGVYSAATGTGTNYAGYFSASGGTTNYAIVVPSGGGNVGIGTSPSFPLDVRTSTEDRVGYFFNSTNTTNNTFGIYAGAHGTGSGEKRGGSFEAVNGTGTNIGVRGMASGGAVNWAGYFDVGNVFISENLGIGVTPGYKLHVQLASTGTLAYFDNNSTAGGTALNANVNTTAVSAGTRYGLNTTAWYGQGINYGVYTYGYGGTTSYGIYATSGGATTNYAGYFNTGDVYIDNNLGIGIPAPTYQIQLSTNSAAKPSSNTWTVASDARLKTNIQEYSEGLKEVLAIHPIWFTYTGEAGMPKETGVGVLAQELQKVAPHMVKDWTYVPSKKEKIAEDGTEIPNGAKAEDVLVPDYTNAKTYLAVDNGAMTYMLINAIKEQQKMIEELKREIDALKNK